MELPSFALTGDRRAPVGTKRMRLHLRAFNCSKIYPQKVEAEQPQPEPPEFVF